MRRASYWEPKTYNYSRPTVPMKADIHPRVNPVIFEDLVTGKRFFSTSTASSERKETVDGVEYSVITCSVTSDSHPFYTGKATFIDTEGRVDKFNRRFANYRKEKPQDEADAEPAAPEAATVPAEESKKD